MGITPLEGLIMGTRSGDVDPALPFYIMRKTGMSPEEMDKALNKKSGCLGITEKYSDRRDIEIAAANGLSGRPVFHQVPAIRLLPYKWAQ